MTLAAVAQSPQYIQLREMEMRISQTRFQKLASVNPLTPKDPYSGRTAPLTSKRRILYRVSQEECARLRESVPYVKLYRYNPKHLHPKLNGYGDNGPRILKL